MSALKRPTLDVPANGAWEAAGDDDHREEDGGVDNVVRREDIQRREAKRILSRIMSDKHVIEQNLKDYKPFGDKWTKNHEESQEYAYYE